MEKMNRHNIIIITGLSGSGKGTAITAFEDAGYYCVDNMPVELLPRFLELPIKNSSGIAGVALVMDLRDSGFLLKHAAIFDELRGKGFSFELVFLEADEKTLLRRFSQTRRTHPVSAKGSLVENIKEEIALLEGLRNDADKIIDTTSYNYHNLKSVIRGIAESKKASDGIAINVMSFGFKHGLPQGADLVVDVRFLQNPYFVPELKSFSGLSENVSDYVLNNDHARTFLEKYLSLLDFLIPRYKSEGKSYLTIAIGCTGGRHRSVAVSETFFRYLKKHDDENISITHRDIDL